MENYYVGKKWDCLYVDYLWCDDVWRIFWFWCFVIGVDVWCFGGGISLNIRMLGII